jgi:glucose/arabinose dehydrogenase
MRKAVVTCLTMSMLVLVVPPGRAAGIGAVPVVTGLNFPAAFTFDANGRIFYADAYAGEVHLYDPSTGSDTLFYTFIGLSQEEAVLGLVLAPGYPNRPYVYVYVVRTVQKVLRDQIVRLKDVGGQGTQPRVIFQDDAGPLHHGGRMLFGSDGQLYVVTGEGDDPAKSQDLTSTLGKMLRMTPAGQVPPGNPFGTLVWAYGLRNSFGWDFDPQTGFLWEQDNGPACNDEINLIRKGKNYGWGPSGNCQTPPPPPRNTNQDGPNPVLPVEYFPTTTAPTGVGFCQGCGLTGAEGHLFYGNYNTFDVHEVVLTSNRRSIDSDTSVYNHSSFVLSIERGPDGALYFSDDTSIYRLVQT